jgi:hypothetical protein
VLSLPEPRGELTEALFAALREPVHTLPSLPVPDGDDVLRDEDLQLALYCSYELHYRGLPDVDDAWEWEPSLLALRRSLEERFEEAAVALAGPRGPEDVAPEEMDIALRAIGDADDGPSLSKILERDGTLEQVKEFLVHRSPYQLKEADPHAWAIPRLHGPPKAALVEIEVDEFGGGRADRIHAELFRKTLRSLGLDDRYGAYVEHVPAVTLATVNLMSWMGLHRRLRGSIIGHLALFEMTSSVPSRRYGNALRRHGLGEDATDFFDEHVEADAVHEAVASVDMAGGLVRQDPSLCGDILWGARALVAVEGAWARDLADAWAARRSSLRVPLGSASAAPA